MEETKRNSEEYEEAFYFKNEEEELARAHKYRNATDELEEQTQAKQDE